MIEDIEYKGFKIEPFIMNGEITVKTVIENNMCNTYNIRASKDRIDDYLFATKNKDKIFLDIEIGNPVKVIDFDLNRNRIVVLSLPSKILGSTSRYMLREISTEKANKLNELEKAILDCEKHFNSKRESWKEEVAKKREALHLQINLQ